jgi:hypothetical protein
MSHATTSPTSAAQPSDFKDQNVNVQVHEVGEELDQKPLSVKDAIAAAVTPTATYPPAFNIPSDFRIHNVDNILGATKPPTDSLQSPVVTSPPLGVLVSKFLCYFPLEIAADAYLNPLALNFSVFYHTNSSHQSNFSGNFAGKGFNLIFRPNSGPPTTTIFPNPVTPAPPTPPSENVLELNLTTETLSFSPPLGNVPNRGLEKQNDIFLNGVPYVQSISDVTNISTGKANNPPAPIHFEPGLWMHVPATADDPNLGASLARMASIPHGTTINAQALEPTTSFAGPPIFAPVDITPFVIGGTQQANSITFASQTASNTDTPRLPQDLTKFIAAGTITQDILTDPNTVLRNDIKGQTITNTIVFTVSTTPASPELGGGTANIAFLLGGATGPQTGPNASAVQMSATFWIETVQHSIVVPPFKPGSVSQFNYS